MGVFVCKFLTRPELRHIMIVLRMGAADSVVIVAASEPERAIENIDYNVCRIFPTALICCKKETQL